MSQEKANINLTNWDIVGINPNDKNWTRGDIFCFWANNIQSLIGFSLIASLYLVYDLNIIIVLTACITAGFSCSIFLYNRPTIAKIWFTISSNLKKFIWSIWS